MNHKIFRKKDLNSFLILIVIFSVFMQLFFVPRLPSKYFYDANGVLSVASGNYNPLYFDNSYIFTGNFFRIINIFGFTNFFQWSYFLTLISLIFCLLYFSKFKKINIMEMILIFLTIALANIYLFRISKDFVQFVFWIIILMFLLNKKQRWYAIVFVLVMEGLMFRSYYNVIAAMFVGFYFLLCGWEKKKNKIIRIMLFALLGLIIGLFVLSKISPSTYNYIVNLRIIINKDRVDSPDAVTMITNIIKTGNNVFVFVINYLINFVRMLFPYELFFKGIKYIPFIIYQNIFTIYLIKSSKFYIKNNNKRYYMYIAIMWAYLAIANLFEPDFGSVVRHEITLFPIYMKLFIDYTTKELENYENTKKY